MIQVGDKVRHTGFPEWGVGKVLEVNARGKIRVFFIHSGDKTLRIDISTLEKSYEPTHPILDHPTFLDRTKAKFHKGLPEACDEFLRKFKLGFEDQLYLDEERNYKVRARKLLCDSLNKLDFSEMLNAGKYTEISKRAMKIVNEANLIFPNEKMQLRDALKSEESVRCFTERLFDLLYGAREFKNRFEDFASCLCMIGAKKDRKSVV